MTEIKYQVGDKFLLSPRVGHLSVVSLAQHGAIHLIWAFVCTISPRHDGFQAILPKMAELTTTHMQVPPWVCTPGDWGWRISEEERKGEGRMCWQESESKEHQSVTSKALSNQGRNSS